jgi:hypothetical protein
MNRARLIVKEFVIQKLGEINFFQIRLPKNATSILGIETDVLMESFLETDTIGSGSHSGGGGVLPDGTIAGSTPDVNLHPFLQWGSKSNPVVGKLKLQSMDRSNIFFENWIPFVLLNGSMPDMSYSLFPKSPYSLIVRGKPKPIGIACSNNIINGQFADSIGIAKNVDMKYRVKIFVWVQTTEPTNGVAFDFQMKDKELEVKL